MARQEINIGVEGNDGTGDSIRESFRKTNENFNELYAIFGAGGTIRFTTLSDTPDNYVPNTVLFIDSNANGIDFRALASNSAADPTADDSIQISYDTPGKIVLSTTFRALSQDLSPQLGGPLDGNNKAIARVAITQAAVDEFNAEQPNPQITIDDLASACIVSSATISQLENGKYLPSSDVVIKLSEGLECSTDFLLLGIVKNKNENNNQDSEESSKPIVIDSFKSKQSLVDTDVLSTLVSLVNETISTKNEVIALQKEYKNEVTTLLYTHNKEMVQEKNEQLNIYKEVLQNYKNNN
jgi:transcriptional regulator with XRE-family HTH domain